MERSKDF